MPQNCNAVDLIINFLLPKTHPENILKRTIVKVERLNWIRAAESCNNPGFYDTSKHHVHAHVALQAVI